MRETLRGLSGTGIAAIVVPALAIAWGCAGTPAPPAAVARAAAPAPVDPDSGTPPLDPALRTGKLANGLTYYVQPHHKPEARAALWLVVNAGSAQEDDDQSGVAHFVEHMAFNGTRRFPKQDIFDYFQQIGMELGADVNARTSFDQTIYQLTVPTDDRAALLKGLDILRDIAGDVTFDAAEVAQERPIVQEEWRMRRRAEMRIAERQRAELLGGGSRYARSPIGDPARVGRVTPAELIRFYRDWYRPDLMAVIAVGDFETAGIEAEIRARFAGLVEPGHARPRRDEAVPRDNGLRISIVTDPEAPAVALKVSKLTDHRPVISKRAYRRYLAEGLVFRMLDQRLAELRDEPGSPLVMTGVGRQALTRLTDTISWGVTAKPRQLPEALRLVFREIERSERHGFLPGELARARAVSLAACERAVLGHDEAPLAVAATNLMRTFIDGEAATGPTVELAWAREILATITIAEVNAIVRSWSGDAGRLVAISAPPRDLIIEAEVHAGAEVARAAAVPPWTDTPAAPPLMAQAPTPGKVVRTARDEAAGATVWALSNGVRVIVKPTAFSTDRVVAIGWQPGGTSLASNADFGHARFAGEIAAASGVGDLDPRHLNNALAGKDVSASVGLGERFGTIHASARRESLETMLQLLYLRLARPAYLSSSFQVWKTRRLAAVRRRRESQEGRMSDEMEAATFADHPRRQPVTEEAIAAVDPTKAMAIWKQRFATFGGMTMVFVGDFDPAQLQPLVETYLGSLPGGARPERWKNVGLTYPTRPIEKVINAGREPKSLVRLSFNVPMPWSLAAQRDMRILDLVVAERLRQALREKAGGTYSVDVRAWVEREPTGRGVLQISFACAPANVERLRLILFAELGAVAEQGASDQLLAQVAEQLRRKHETDIKDNVWWAETLKDAYYFGDDVATITDIAAFTGRATSANVRATAHRILDKERYALIVVQPETTASAAAAPPNVLVPAAAPAGDAIESPP